MPWSSSLGISNNIGLCSASSVVTRHCPFIQRVDCGNENGGAVITGAVNPEGYT